MKPPMFEGQYMTRREILIARMAYDLAQSDEIDNAAFRFPLPEDALVTCAVSGETYLPCEMRVGGGRGIVCGAPAVGTNDHVAVCDDCRAAFGVKLAPLALVTS